MVNEVVGDVIRAALNGDLNAIVQSCNCFCTQKKGIVLEMVKAFGTDKFPLEKEEEEADYNKLGQIDFKLVNTKVKNIWVVNAYCQYHWYNHGPYGIPLDYDAFRLCFRKINKLFPNEKVGVPGLIGCGLARGDSKIIKKILQEECTKIKLIIYYPETF